MEKVRVQLRDSKIFAGQKNAISIRDGVLEYLGAEIGMQPADKVFTVYRSPATISNAARQMAGMTVTYDHVPESEVDQAAIGVTGDTEMIDMYDESVDSTIAAKHPVQFRDGFQLSDAQELSWDYNGDLVEHHKYDLEQKNLEPLRLAIVERARCGSSCRFVDKKTVETDVMSQKQTKVDKAETDTQSAFKDADGSINMQNVAETVEKLRDAIKTMPLDEVQKIMGPIMEVVQASTNSENQSITEDEMIEQEEQVEDEMIEQEGQVEDGDYKDEESMESDEDKKDFKDSVAFKDAVTAAVKRHGEVIEKAKEFLDDSYTFADKDTTHIMRDAVNTQHQESFSDSELPLAFKMLKKQAAYTNFADGGRSTLADLADKEL